MSLLDRYTYYRNIIPKSQLQTLGTSCLFLAAKMEEVNPPDIYRLVEYSDGAVTIDDLVKLVSNNFKQLILTDPNSIYKLLVLSPSPWGYSSVVEHSTADREVPGSNPGVPLFCEFITGKWPAVIVLQVLLSAGRAKMPVCRYKLPVTRHVGQ